MAAKELKIDTIKSEKELEVGHKSFGWRLTKKYKRFNLWERRTRLGYMRRECFDVGLIPLAPKLD